MSSLRMILVLGGIALASGLSLGALNEATYERAANNVLKFKKIPAVVDICRTMGQVIDEERRLALEEELLFEKRYVDIGADEPLLLFPVREGDDVVAVALEGVGAGFGGDVGVMVGMELSTALLAGVGVTTMSETPGVGTRVREDAFTAQFRGLAATAVLRVKKDGGEIDAVTGATVSSRAVAQAVEQAVAVFREHEPAIREAVATEGAAPAADPGGVS